ncbi:MAG: squalene/phytoene synthase family protein [Rhodobacteraceae bacterium]|nr:squalene/phytoene synthase family protein [Paracoccaceae bacterium]
MRFDDNITACAGLVQRADPDRFMAAMAAPVSVRGALFVLYAFNVEVARAPWVTNEPEIAAMRLQWWRDALEEIAAGKGVRRHEVVTPLAAIINVEQATVLDELICARYWDINNVPFQDLAGLFQYLDQTSGHLIRVCAQVLGDADETVVTDFGFATGLANWLRAVPELRARGRMPLPDGSPEAIRGLAQAGLDRLQKARAHRAGVSRLASSALLVGWQTETVLRRTLRDPARVNTGTLMPGEFRRRISLMRQVVTGRW